MSLFFLYIAAVFLENSAHGAENYEKMNGTTFTGRPIPLLYGVIIFLSYLVYTVLLAEPLSAVSPLPQEASGFTLQSSGFFTPPTLPKALM